MMQGDLNESYRLIAKRPHDAIQKIRRRRMIRIENGDEVAPCMRQSMVDITRLMIRIVRA